MASSSQPAAHPSVTCAENIAFLHLLHTVPVPPSRNKAEARYEAADGYILSFQQERSLTGTLAFLAGLKDGPEHIPAVCIEEDQREGRLNVLIAVNKAKAGDGDVVLKEIRSGLQKIFASLSCVIHGHDRSLAQGEIFSLIVAMCTIRIRCRLRLSPNSRHKPRQPIKDVIETTIESLQRSQTEKKLPKDLVACAKLFRERAGKVITLIDSWSGHQVQARLERLIEGIYNLSLVNRLEDLFKIISSSKTINPSIPQNLYNTIRKVGRYKEAARVLYRLAKRVRLVRNMEVILIRPPVEAFQRPCTDGSQIDLSSKLLQIQTSHNKKTWDLTQIRRLLGYTAEAAFTQRQNKVLKDSKIHAEVQLISYNNLRNLKLAPRVICSSKDACFLCNLLISACGMHTPGSHGRLYSGWRMPHSTKLTDMDERFNKILEHQIVGSIETLIERGRKTFHPDPCESTLFTLLSSASTILGFAQSEQLGGGNGQRSTSEKVQALGAEDSSSAAPVTAPTTTNSCNAVKQTSTNKNVTHLSESTSQLRLPLCKLSMKELYLRRGEKVLITLTPGDVSAVYTTGKLEVQLEFEATTNTKQMRSGQERQISYSLEWLVADEMQIESDEGISREVDVDVLIGVRKLAPDNSGSAYLFARGHYVRLRRQSGQKGAVSRFHDLT